jgi:hypothetical protein
MANEAVIIELTTQNAVNRTCADGATIEKGTILELADPNTVTANDGSGDVFGGIAAVEKVASDGATTIPAWMSGVFDLTCAASTVTAGQWVSTSGANLIKTATEAELAAGKGIGRAEETGTASEVIRVRLGNN